MLEEGFAVAHSRGSGGGLGGLSCGGVNGGSGGRLALCLIESQQAVDILRAPGGESDFARGESEDAAPASEDGDVLFAVDSVGYGGGDDAALRVGGPQLLPLSAR